MRLAAQSAVTSNGQPGEAGMPFTCRPGSGRGSEDASCSYELTKARCAASPLDPGRP